MPDPTEDRVTVDADALEALVAAARLNVAAGLDVDRRLDRAVRDLCGPPTEELHLRTAVRAWVGAGRLHDSGDGDYLAELVELVRAYARELMREQGR